jgi:hypothetical protein
MSLVSASEKCQLQTVSIQVRTFFKMLRNRDLGQGTRKRVPPPRDHTPSPPQALKGRDTSRSGRVSAAVRFADIPASGGHVGTQLFGGRASFSTDLAPKTVGLAAMGSRSKDAHSTPSIAHGSFLEREADYQTRPKFSWFQPVTPSPEETHDAKS